MMERICEDDWIVDDSSLWPFSVVGQGSYGSVILMGDSQFRCYAKKVSSMNLFRNLKKELDIMIHFRNHPYIVGPKSPCVYSKMNANGERVCYIYMEYANKGSLDDVISKFHGKALPEYIIQRVARMILQGLHALHLEGYVHCDLKPANILLFPSTTYGEPFDLKLADFGLSKDPNHDYALPCGSIYPGTPEYMPLDSLGPDGPIDPALDIWSLGCVVYEMFGGEPMKEYLEDYYVYWSLTEDISPVAKDFLRRCHSPHQLRASVYELLTHPFITQRLTVPLPADLIGPISTRRQQEDWMVIPKLPGSIW